jgi:hypothetical protein
MEQCYETSTEFKKKNVKYKTTQWAINKQKDEATIMWKIKIMFS